MSCRWGIGLVVLGLVGAASGGARAASDPFCTASYGAAPARVGAPLRFGIDPGIAGSVGGVQLPSVADDPTRDLEALRALRPPGRQLVLRLNRLFWSAGDAGIADFQHTATADTAAGFDVEIQVRYHPGPGQTGDITAWQAYVRRVVDAFGPNPRVVAMTITNEVNVAFSPNTSDGYFGRAQDALIAGIETAHDEALRRGFRQLRFGFTYAYRFLPNQDAAFFDYLGAHGGPVFRGALDFVGLDFYPGSVYPPVILPGDSYRAELAQALGIVRDCLAPKAGIGVAVPIWITENGIPTGVSSDDQQAAALDELVRAANALSATFNVTDYRWFNLRDSTSTGPTSLVGATFASDGLLRDDYTRKPAFAAYRRLIAEYGATDPSAGPGTPKGSSVPGCRAVAAIGLPPLRGPERVALYLGSKRVATARGHGLRVIRWRRPPWRVLVLRVVVVRPGRRTVSYVRRLRPRRCGFLVDPPMTRRRRSAR